MNAKNIVVFGGSGFLGSHVADFLTQQGHHVTIFDKNQSPYIQAEQNFTLGDITDQNVVDQAVSGKDVIYNFAGIADIDEASEMPQEAVYVNIIGNTNIMEACRKNNIERYIFASTMYVYSSLGSFYRASKQACELIIEEYYKKYGQKFTILRYGSLYGPRAGTKNFVYRVLRDALVTGKITRYGNGEELREYIHVYDAARLSGKILEPEYENKHIILTGHEKMKVREFLYMIKEILGGRPEIEFRPVDNVAARHHYVITPFDFTPKLGRKITDYTHVDLGQGILDMLNRIHSEKTSSEQDNFYRPIKYNEHSKTEKFSPLAPFKKDKAVCALIKGRAGSVGFPGKNTHPVFGRPLMRYPMMAAEKAKTVTLRYFSTEAEDYKEIGRKHGWRIIDRPVELASNTALSTDVFLHAYNWIRREAEKENFEIEFLVLLMCNAPMILAETIDRGIELLRARPEADSAVTVSKYNMWNPLRARRETGEGFLRPFVSFEHFGDPKHLSCDRDSAGDVWFADMGVSIVRPRCIENMEDGLLPQKWMGKKILPLKQEGGFDIDYQWELPLVEHWLCQKGFSENITPYDNH